MTEGDMNAQIGEATIERKRCLDQMSCYTERLKTAKHALNVFLAENKNPLNEDNQQILDLSADPRADAEGFIKAMTRANELEDFLRKHNAL